MIYEVVKVRMVKWMLREEAQALCQVPLTRGTEIFTECVTEDGRTVIMEAPVHRDEPFEVMISTISWLHGML